MTKKKSGKKEENGLKKDLEEKEAKLQEHLNDLKRVQAEFENYIKRSEREKEDLIRYAKKGMAESLVKVMDNFERAMHSMEKATKDDLVKGLEMTFQEFKSAMKSEGLEEIESIGKKLDTNLHEVIKTEESGEDEDVVVKELEKGYLFQGKVLRPAKVIISGGKENE